MNVFLDVVPQVYELHLKFMSCISSLRVASQDYELNLALLHRVPPRYLHERIGGFLRPYNGTISGSISVVFT